MPLLLAIAEKEPFFKLLWSRIESGIAESEKWICWQSAYLNVLQSLSAEAIGTNWKL